jgi:maltooligosyltrehalose trehalohydrolase
VPFSSDATVPERGPAELITRRQRLSAGAGFIDGQTTFRFRAPAADTVSLVSDADAAETPMSRSPDGWHSVTTDRARPGTRYRYRLSDGTLVPDPASRFQPHGVHGPSEVIDPSAYAWRDGEWTTRKWSEAIVYELHVGTFTRDGTFAAAIEKLAHLVALGVTCINLMPVAEFPGRRNWGYDGVFLYAPASPYGRPDDLKAFVDAAHRHGLMVLLDVVYNHFGPDGNLLPKYAPQTFTDRHQTPWGDAVNFDGEGSAAVREFVVQNALYWLVEFHFDGLRLDAVHALVDESPTHILDELAARVREACAPRTVHLVIENEANQSSRLGRTASGRPEQYTAQWNDDIHHVLHTALTGETDSYYIDFVGDTAKLGRALAEGFAFQGETMQSTGRARGEEATRLPPAAFVSFLQNHDQVGNRAMGERVHALAPLAATRAAAAVYLLHPQVPMLFMGEEWGSRQPFPFFCDFAGEIGEAVSKGRREEFADFAAFKDPAKRAQIPDPQAVESFDLARLDWNSLLDDDHARWLDWYTDVIALREREIRPLVEQIDSAGTFEVLGPGAVVVRFSFGQPTRVLTLVANLSPQPSHDCPELRGRLLWQEGPPATGRTLPPWSVRWSVEDQEPSR